MTNSKVLMAALLGGVACFFLGWLIYGMLLMDFMMQNTGLDADTLGKFNKPMEEMVWWAMILSNLLWGYLLALIFSWANINTAGGGAKAGAIITVIIVAGYDLSFYAMTNLVTMPSIAADLGANLVMGAIAGAVVGWMLGRGNAPAAG